MFGPAESLLAQYGFSIDWVNPLRDDLAHRISWRLRGAACVLFIKVFEQLQEEFIAKRWDRLLKQIDERKKIDPITDEEIEKEIKCARKKFHKNCC